MYPATPLTKPFAVVLFWVCAGLATANPQDQAVESYLRAARMDTLLEVQLESRLEASGDPAERAALGEELSQLYLRLLRELDHSDPYRVLLLNRASDLVQRITDAPMYELRLELLISAYGAQEESIELHRLRLLGAAQREDAREAMLQTSRGLRALLSTLEPKLNRLDRRRTQPLGEDEARRVAIEIDDLRRQRSLAHYYLGWAGYGLAVLEDRHVGDDVFISFGWILGNEGGMPQSIELGQAALEYEHVARSAIGVALCYAQSDGGSLAQSWLTTLLDSTAIEPAVREAAEYRLLQVYAMSRDWFDANQYARLIIKQRDDVRAIRTGDARFLAIRALDSRLGGPPGQGGEQEATKLAQFGIEQLVELGEIGHVVDLYQRYEHLPLLAQGFIPNYARALAQLNRLESGEASTGFLDIAEQLRQALGAGDADDYPDHREDCQLKLAYALIRGDRPEDALVQCDQVIERSLRDSAIEEARWLKIGAYDRSNVLSGRDASAELDRAVRAYVEAYPSTPRTAKLVLRHAMRGTIDQQLAIETLASITDDDPIAIPARRALVQLQYRMLRAKNDGDLDLLRDTRQRIAWLVDQNGTDTGKEDASQANIAILRIGIDLALRDDPADTGSARAMIGILERLVDLSSSLRSVEPELLMRRLQIAMYEGRIERALALVDELRSLDPRQGEQAEILVLNELIELWGQVPNPILARNLVDLGVVVLARLTPPAPEPIGLQVSGLMEVVIHGAVFSEQRQSNPADLSLALRLAKQILLRGQPSESGLLRTASVAAQLGDTQTELEAWLRLLAAYPIDEDRWYEARYESLRVMQLIDPIRARDTFVQFRVLNPALGPSPWDERIGGLFGVSPSTGPGEGGQRP